MNYLNVKSSGSICSRRCHTQSHRPQRTVLYQQPINYLGEFTTFLGTKSTSIRGYYYIGIWGFINIHLKYHHSIKDTKVVTLSANSASFLTLPRLVNEDGTLLTVEVRFGSSCPEQSSVCSVGSSPILETLVRNAEE